MNSSRRAAGSRKLALLALLLGSLLFWNVPLAMAGSAPPSPIIPSPPAGSGTPGVMRLHYVLLCGGIANPTGQVLGIAGSFVEDFSGNLSWCTGGTSTHIASRPSDAPKTGQAYQFMAGVRTNFGMILVLSDTLHSGMWFCIGANSTGCSLTSHFVTVCGGTCRPEGISMDKKLNVYFVDYFGKDIMKCTYGSGYKACSVYQNMTGGDGPGHALYMDINGNTWVSDAGCGGYVWYNGAVIGSDPNAGYAWSITVSSSNPEHVPHVYVGSSDPTCAGTVAGVYDFTEGHFLSTPLTGGDYIYGLTTNLQFTTYTAGNVYLVHDTT